MLSGSQDHPQAKENSHSNNNMFTTERLNRSLFLIVVVNIITVFFLEIRSTSHKCISLFTGIELIKQMRKSINGLHKVVIKQIAIHIRPSKQSVVIEGDPKRSSIDQRHVWGDCHFGVHPSDSRSSHRKVTK